jgi:hypothetical protein
MMLGMPTIEPKLTKLNKYFVATLCRTPKEHESHPFSSEERARTWLTEALLLSDLDGTTIVVAGVDYGINIDAALDALVAR